MAVCDYNKQNIIINTGVDANIINVTVIFIVIVLSVNRPLDLTIKW